MTIRGRNSLPVSFYFDQHIPYPIRDQLILRGVDVLTTQQDGTETL